MKLNRTDWAAVGHAVTKRVEELNWDQAELVRRSGLSDPLVRGIMRGTPRGTPRPKNLRTIAETLGWSSDSIDRILEGGTPVEVDQPAHTWEGHQPEDVAALVAEMREFMAIARERRGDIDEMFTRVEEVSRAALVATEGMADLTRMVRTQSERIDMIADFVRRREAALVRRPGELEP